MPHIPPATALPSWVTQVTESRPPGPPHEPYAAIEFVPTRHASQHHGLGLIATGPERDGYLPAAALAPQAHHRTPLRDSRTEVLVEPRTESLPEVYGHLMQGHYSEMVLSGRNPRHLPSEVEKKWGFYAARLASITLPYASVGVNHTIPDRHKALDIADAATAIRFCEHDLIVFGASEETHYIVTTRAFLDRLAVCSRSQRNNLMRRSPDVKRLGPGDSLYIGRGYEDNTLPATKRWLPSGVLAQEKRAKAKSAHPDNRRMISDRQGQFRVSPEAILTYCSQGTNPAVFSGDLLPPERAYNRAVRKYNAAARLGESAHLAAARDDLYLRGTILLAFSGGVSPTPGLLSHVQHIGRLAS